MSDKTAAELKKAIKIKQEYGGIEKKTEKPKNVLDRPMAIEGEKQLAITGGESMAGSGDVKDQKKSDSGNDMK